MKSTKNVSHSVIVFVIAYSCFLLNGFAQDVEEIKTTAGKTAPRLTSFFDIGEKSVDKNTRQRIKVLSNFDSINAFSILDVKLKQGGQIIPDIRERGYNVLMVAELKKRGEETWNRISVVNRYTWKIARSSVDKVKSPTSMGQFYVMDEILSENPFIKEGDNVQALFFYDVMDGRPYLDDLYQAQSYSHSLMSIDVQEMFLITVGSAPQKYAAKDGDRIRLRFFRAEYSIDRARKIKSMMKDGREPGAPLKYADVISVDDEMNFVIKEFGIKLTVSPVIAYGSQTGDEFEWGEFNLVSKNPSFGSNVYFYIEDRNPAKNILNYMPGIHLSLLGLNSADEAKFTFAFVWSPLPSLRKWFGIFYGWHDLKTPVFGLTFSPNIDFQALVKPKIEKTDGQEITRKTP